MEKILRGNSAALTFLPRNLEGELMADLAQSAAIRFRLIQDGQTLPEVDLSIYPKVEGEIAAEGSGTSAVSGTLQHVPIKVSSGVSMTDGADVYVSNSSGELLFGANVVGSINFVTGDWSMTLNSPLMPGESLQASYSQDLAHSQIQIDYPRVGWVTVYLSPSDTDLPEAEYLPALQWESQDGQVIETPYSGDGRIYIKDDLIR